MNGMSLKPSHDFGSSNLARVFVPPTNSPITQTPTYKQPTASPRPNSPKSIHSGKTAVFKAERVCRLSIHVNCADLQGDAFLFGTDEGLYAFETKGTSRDTTCN